MRTGVGTVLRNPVAWVFVLLAGLAAFITTFSYLGAFLDPDTNARNLPLAFVDEDRGVMFAGQSVALGEDVSDQITAPNPALGDAVEWTVLPSRRAAVRALARDDYFAALVVPRDFSARVLEIAAASEGSAPRAATIEVLANPASGAYAGTFSQTVATKAVEAISEATSKQLSDVLTAAGTRVSPAAARAIGHPVEATITIAQPTGERGGRGIAPFYFAVVLSLAGVMSAVVVSTGIDYLTGGTTWDLLGRRFQRSRLELSSFSLWRAKAIAVVATAVLAGWLATWMAVGLLDMQVGSVWDLGLFATLAVAMSAMATLTLLSTFGIAGELLALFFIVIFGVPSAGGVYPEQALPGFFQFLHGFLPLRFITDGVRALIFFGGADVGLRRAVEVLVAYAAGAALLGALVTRRIDIRARARLDASTARSAE